MKLAEFAELMNLSLEEAEKLLQKEDVITINLNNEKVNTRKSKGFSVPRKSKIFKGKEKEDLIIDGI